MKYTRKECKKIVDFACEGLDDYSVCPDTAKKIVADAITGLTGKQLKSLELYVLRGMTYRQISVQLGNSLSGARTECMKAVHHIRRVYNKHISLDGPTMILNLGLSTRISHALYRAGYTTLNDISCLTEEDLCEVRGIGKEACAIIKNKLEEFGLSLKPSHTTHNDATTEITVKFKMPKECLKPGRNIMLMDYDADTGEFSYIDSFHD